MASSTCVLVLLERAWRESASGATIAVRAHNGYRDEPSGYLMLSCEPSHAGPNRLIKPLYVESSSERCKSRLDVLALRVSLLSADLRIPIRRRIGEELTLPAERTHRFFIHFDAQAWPRRNGDVTVHHEVPFVA